ncbi:MAG: hypothetical protein KA712_08570 [Myxococcales bacterium]|nr:hypothetical protein [Myxococcales bacterium]
MAGGWHHLGFGGARALVLLLGLGLGWGRARAAAPEAVGTCPESPAIERALASALPAAELARLLAEPAPLAMAFDEGTTFVVQRGTQRRVLEDPERDCAARARNAAVFLVLALSLEATTAPQPPPTRVAETVSPWQLEGAAVGEFVPGLGAAAGAHVALSPPAWGPWQLATVGGATHTLGARFEGLEAEELRVFARGGGRFLFGGPVWEGAVSALGALTWTRWELAPLPRAQPDAVLVGSVQAEARLGWRLGRFRPFVALGVEWLPAPPRVRLDPGLRFRTPGLRWQPQLGLAISIP